MPGLNTNIAGWFVAGCLNLITSGTPPSVLFKLSPGRHRDYVDLFYEYIIKKYSITNETKEIGKYLKLINNRKIFIIINKFNHLG